jgi:CRP-like cAMP-binding protein
MYACGNLLLDTLSPQDIALLRPHLEAVDLPFRHVMEEANKAIQHVYFMEAGVASMVASAHRDGEIEVGVIGSEGMSGIAVLMGKDRSPNKTCVQIAGSGQRISAEEFRHAINTSRTLHQALLKYAHAFLVLTTHTAFANGRGSLEQRLARWLLMLQDRVGSAELRLSHELLSTVLGVRRAGVTTAIGAFEDHGLIRHGRSCISIVDRTGLEEVAGTFYGAPERELRRFARSKARDPQPDRPDDALRSPLEAGA